MRYEFNLIGRRSRRSRVIRGRNLLGLSEGKEIFILGVMKMMIEDTIIY